MSWKGWEDYKPPTEAKTVKSKYGSQPTEVDGIRFDSKREAARYRVLVVRMKAGDIRRLRCQPRYDLKAVTPSNRQFGIAEYVADFEYEERNGEEWNLVVEDAKGAKTDLYRLKRRWFQTQYGIEIRES